MLDSTDHSWWFQALYKNDVLIFAGPYIIKNEKTRNRNFTCVKIRTNGLIFSIKEIENELNRFNIQIHDVTLMWHVLEASATCRVNDLRMLVKATRIAVVADTHHLKDPISSLIKIIKREPYDLLCCTHNQYEPFFEVSCGLKTISFPYINPYEEVEKYSAKSDEELQIRYYGNPLSPTHFFRSIFVGEALRSSKISIMPRMNMKSWTNSLWGKKNVLY